MPIAKEGLQIYWVVRGWSSVVIRPHRLVIATVLAAIVLGVVMGRGKQLRQNLSDLYG